MADGSPRETDRSVPRVGVGFDSHPVAPERPLLLGGVRFEGEPGLAGHSDGDVVCHAVADAVLGAAALGDLGSHFPESDPAFDGIAGPAVLARTVALAQEADLAPASCDVVVLAGRPMIGPRRDEMREVLASTLGVGIGAVSVKATRPEGLGLVGDGIASLAVAVLVPS